MKKAIIGKKLGMTQLFDERGNVVPVTAVEAGPCVITQVKTVENDGYAAYQYGFGEIKVSHVNVFAEGDSIDVTGTSKGKGTAGVIKRWNFQRLKESHGTGPVHRHAGSQGACSSPSRVFKGTKGAGRLGCERVTVQNLEIVKVDVENNIIAIKGAIPGPKGGIVMITDSVKA